MPHNGPIVIIEDDLDDQYILKRALLELEVKNELVFFENGPDAYNYLEKITSPPLLILCDVNMPRQSGIEFKKELDDNPKMRARAIPFIFYTTYVSQYAINEAYQNLTVQGFFQKSNTYGELKEVIKKIVDYWQICKLPVDEKPSP